MTMIDMPTRESTSNNHALKNHLVTDDINLSLRIC